MSSSLPRIAAALSLVLMAVGSALGQTRATGLVLNGLNDQPLADATIEGGDTTTTTGPDGRFALDLRTDTAEIRVSAAGYLDTVVQVSDAVLEVRLFPSNFAETVEVVSDTTREEQRPSSTPVTPEEVFRAPGSIDNVFRTLQTLPGVVATDDFGSRLAVRGGTPDQNLTMMDGIEVHNPFRLFGIASAFNPDTVENFQLTAGGFGAAYGDRLSSLLIVDNRHGRPDFQGTTAASVTDANVVVEGTAPVGANGTWLLSARRTYYDLVAGPLADQDFPSFADVQFQTSWEMDPGHRLTITGLSSIEDASLDFGDEGDGERAALGSNVTNNLVSARFDAVLGGRSRTSTIVSWYDNEEQFNFDGQIRSDAQRSNAPDGVEAALLSDVIFDRTFGVRDVSLRQEVDVQLSSRHLISTGLELHRLETGVIFNISGDRNPNEANGSSVRGGAGLPKALDSTLTGTRGGLWLQDTFTTSERWSFEPGLRLDWSTINGHTTLSPRLASSVALGRGARLRAAFGLYTQSPGYEKLTQSDYFIDLTGVRERGLVHEKATHVVIGIEQQLSENLLARVEGYYKRFNDLLLGRLETEPERAARLAAYDFPAALATSVPTAALILSTPNNDAGGDAYGVDLFLQHSDPGERLTGWMTYAWGRATRESYGRRYAFEYDRRHAFNAVGRLRLTSRWDLAATVRLASGFPYTPALGLRVASDEDERGRLLPARDSSDNLVYTVDYGGVDNLNRGRLPHYARIDLRATYQRGRWSAYLEIINLLGRDNPIRFEPRLDHNPAGALPLLSEVPAEGFPRIPTFGVRVSF